MTQTRLQIIGPYTPEHEGPFCTRDGVPVRLLTRTDGTEEYPIVGYVGGDSGPVVWDNHGYYFDFDKPDENDLMNAREVPVAREFWIVDYDSGKTQIHNSLAGAVMEKTEMAHIIHVREVLPGEGE